MSISLHPATITRRLRAARLGVIRSHRLADGALRVYAYGPAEARMIAAHLIQLGCDAAAAGDRVTVTLPEEPAEEPAEGPQDAPAAEARPLTGELRHEAHCKRNGGVWADPCTCTPRYWTRQELDAARTAVIEAEEQSRVDANRRAPAEVGGAPASPPLSTEEPHRHVGYFDRNSGRSLCRYCDADLTRETPDNRCDAAAQPGPAYPPLSTEETVAALDAGLAFVADGAGSYSFRIEERRTHRQLGKVRAVTEELGRGYWVRYAAYRPDGSRVGYADNRRDAAVLLRDDARV